MAQKLDHFTPRGRKDPHPWEHWLDGNPHILTQGEDFTCTLESITMQVIRKAARKGLGVSLDMHPEGVLEFRVYSDS